MKGGALTINSFYGDINAEQSFDIFEKNSSVEFFTRGTTGLLYLLKFKPEPIVPSPFVSLNPMGEEIKVIILKICLISNDVKYFKFKFLKTVNTEYNRIQTITKTQMNHEADIQQYVYNNSIDYFSPVTPCMICFNHILITPKIRELYFKGIEDIRGDDRDISLQKLITENQRLGIINNITHVGIMLMEYPQNTLESLDMYRFNNDEETSSTHNKNVVFKHALAFFEILRLFFDTKVIQGDLHDGNILINTDVSYFGPNSRQRAYIIDWGRSLKKQITLTEEDSFESACKNIVIFTKIMNIIFNAGYLNNDGNISSYGDSLGQYHWIKDDNIIAIVFPRLSHLYDFREKQKLSLQAKYNHEITTYQSYRCSMLPDSPNIAQLSIVYLKAIIASDLKQNIAKTVINTELANIHTNTTHLSDEQGQALYHFAQQYNLSLNKMMQKTIDLLLISQNIINQDIANLLHAINFLQNKPELAKGGGIKFPEQMSQVVTLEKSLNKNKEKQQAEITAKIAEIKQIQATMADTFADWRNEVYKIYTNPNVEERNAFYQEQTPFNILTHLMVCCGLFGPLKSGMYIDVKEEENKELYDKLNSIAAAFLTINNGYLSMSNVKTQLMIEDAKKASVSVPVNEKVEVQLEGPTVEVSQPGKPLTGSMLDTREEIAGFGGNKKYSRRKRRRHSKRQKKCCRKKSNKRFYSKKRYSKKRRKYSKLK
jgi:hypothetical protein